jgi:CBS-domain-containing membrane protein
MHKQLQQGGGANFSTFIGVENLPRSLLEKALCTIGAFVSIMAVYFISISVLGANAAIPVVASMGATALLLFSVPHGALSQPWPVFAGQVISAAVGVFVARHVADPLIAAPLAVALCTLLMLLGRCLHPPGAASALTAVFASDAVRDMGYGFVIAPVALNALTLLVIAFVFNAPFKWRRYPSGWRAMEEAPVIEPLSSSFMSHDDFIKAVEDLDTFIDVSEDDLRKLHDLISRSEVSGRH